MQVRDSCLFYVMMKNASLQRATMSQLDTKRCIIHALEPEYFAVGLRFSSREAQFLQHIRNVMKMVLL